MEKEEDLVEELETTTFQLGAREARLVLAIDLTKER
jgi:hypothetical protein